MIKRLNNLVANTALVGALLVSGCAYNRSVNEHYNPQSAYSSQAPKRDSDFENQLRKIIQEEGYTEQFDFIEKQLIFEAPRTEKEKIAIRKKASQIDLSAPANGREKKIIERFSKYKPELTPVEKVFLRVYGLQYDAQSRIYLNRKAAEIFESERFK
jgi:hypothetical protein